MAKQDSKHTIAPTAPASVLSGEIFVEGVDVAQMTSDETADLRRRRVGYILQAFNMVPFLTAEENVALPLVLDGVKQSEIDVRVRNVLATVDMLPRAAHYPAHLSGGEQQRIAIGRALVIRPAIILADEPTGNLDRAGGRAILDLIREINERMHVTVLLVTHDPVFAAYAKRVLRLVDGTLDQDMTLGEGSDVPPDGGMSAAG